MKQTTLSKQVLSLWGKKNINNNNEKQWLPLIAHLVDTKNVIGWLYNHWLDDGQREILNQDFDDNEEVQNLVEFLGYIHDIGKATPAFQTKKSFVRNEDLDQELLEKLIRNGFNGLDELNLQEPRKSLHAVAGETILENAGLCESVGAIIGGHHGKPQEEYFDYEDQLDAYTANYYQSDSYKENPTRERWEHVQNELIDYGLALCNWDSLEDIPEVSQPQAVILEGLVIMADWLASSEFILRDDQKIPLFPLISVDQNFTDIDETQRYQEGILNWIATDSWEPQPVVQPEKQYQKRWGFNPRAVQQKMSEIIGDSVDPGMIIMEAPMGIGKTEVALTAVEQLAAKTGRNGLFFGLPTQATANAMFARIDDWLKEIANEEDIKVPIKLMHGKAQFNEEYRNLPKAGNIESDEGSVVVNEWFTGKKSILTDFVIGTVDQLLLMGLKQKHLALRHLGLSGKIVVIDEIHAYDTYMDSYLEKAIEWLGAYNVPVIALSATLPVTKRNSLLEAYAKGKFGTKKFKTRDNGWQNCQAYPLLSVLDGQELVQTTEFEAPKTTTHVKVKRLNVEDDELIDRVNNKIKDGGVAGVIVNTVKHAQSLAQIAKEKADEDTQILLLHSAFLATDRSKIEDKLHDSIGKGKKRPEKLIVIGTQVLEQSLDIDFDVMFTDIAPMDLILQRAGRLHRHQIDRPEKLKGPQLYVMGIKGFGDYDGGTEAIYEQYLLMKTDYFLKDEIDLPADISLLVQDVYSEDTDSEIDNIDEAKSKLDVDQHEAKRKARGYQLARPEENETLHGWLDNSNKASELSDVKAEAAVRDTKESIEVILLRKEDNDYYLLSGENIEDVSDSVVAQQVIRLPHALTMNVEKSIETLEKITKINFPEWKDSAWLRGVVTLILDKNSEAEFEGYKVKYSSGLGLTYEKV